MATQVSDVFSTAVPSESARAEDSATKKSLFDKVSGAVSNHPKVVIAVIILLVVALIAVIAYFYGIGPVGPHSSFKACATAYRSQKRGATAAPPEKAPPAADAETEKLIAEINSAV